MIKEKYTSSIKEVSLNVVQTSIESVRRKNITRTGLRIYKDGLIGTAGAIGNYDQLELEKRAEESLKDAVPYSCDISKERKESLNLCSPIIDENHIVPEFEYVLDGLKTNHPDFIFSNKINIAENEISLKNDAGLDLNYRDKYMCIDLAFKEKSSVNIIDGGFGYKGRKYERKQFINALDEILSAYKNKVDFLGEKRYPVIFSNAEELPLLKFITDLNGQMFIGNTSLFGDKIGKKAFNKNFTLIETRNPEDSIAPFFDAEGTVNENYRYNLIEDGVILSPCTDKKTASMINMPLTGSAVSEYDGIPTAGVSNLWVKPSQYTAKELLGGRPGIFVVIASGGDFTPDGSFGTPVQLSLLYDGEKFIGRLPELKISSNIYEMFGDAFIGVSKDSVFPLINEKCMIMDLMVSKL